MDYTNAESTGSTTIATTMKIHSALYLQSLADVICEHRAKQQTYPLYFKPLIVHVHGHELLL